MFAFQATGVLVCMAAIAGWTYITLRCWASEKHDPARWAGKSLDAAKLKPNIDRVRQDYLAACQPTKGVCFHRSMLALARRAVAQSAYLRDRKAEEHAPAHSPTVARANADWPPSSFCFLS